MSLLLLLLVALEEARRDLLAEVERCLVMVDWTRFTLVQPKPEPKPESPVPVPCPALARERLALALRLLLELALGLPMLPHLGIFSVLRNIEFILD